MTISEVIYVLVRYLGWTVEEAAECALRDPEAAVRVAAQALASAA